MTCTADGFSAWGKDIGGYSSNPEVAAENEAIFHHKTGGMAEDGTTVEFAALNDHGYDWWTNGRQAGAGGPRVLRLRRLHRGQLDRDAGQVQRRLSPTPASTGPLGAERRF